MTPVTQSPSLHSLSLSLSLSLPPSLWALSDLRDGCRLKGVPASGEKQEGRETQGGGREMEREGELDMSRGISQTSRQDWTGSRESGCETFLMITCNQFLFSGL